MRNLRLVITLQQRLPIRHTRRRNRVRNWRPECRAHKDPRNRRPKRMRQQAKERFAGRLLLRAAYSAVYNSRNTQGNVACVEKREVVPADDFNASPEGSAELGVAFVEVGGDTACWFEGGGLAAEPFGEDEGAHYC